MLLQFEQSTKLFGEPDDNDTVDEFLNKTRTNHFVSSSKVNTNDFRNRLRSTLVKASDASKCDYEVTINIILY